MTMSDFLQLASAWNQLGSNIQKELRTIFVEGADVPLPELLANFEVGDGSLNSIHNFLSKVIEIAPPSDEIVMEADDILTDIIEIWGAE